MFYFDHYQSKDPKDSLAIHRYNPLEAVYHYSIIPQKIKEAGLDNKIIGGHANLWTEYIGSETKVDYMVLPRMAALGENLWSGEERKNYKDFLRRLESSSIPPYRGESLLPELQGAECEKRRLELLGCNVFSSVHRVWLGTFS